MKTVYADVILFENFVLDYIILHLSAVSMYIRIKPMRMIGAATVGAAYALLVSVFPLRDFVRPVLSAVMLLLLCGFVLGRRKIRVYIRFYVTMYVFSMLLCGFLAMLPVGNIYVTIPAVVVVIVLFVMFSVKIPETLVMKNDTVRVKAEIDLNQRTYNAVLVCDSGNLLDDPYTKLPVIVVNENFIGNEDKENMLFRPVPFSTVSGTGVMWVITPQSIRILKKGKWNEVRASIGICHNGQRSIKTADGVVPARIIETM